MDANQSGDGNLAPLKKTGVETGVESEVEFGVEPGEPMEIDPEDGDQIDPKDGDQIDPEDGLMHQLDNQLDQLGKELDEWSVIPTDQSMEQQPDQSQPTVQSRRRPS